MTHGVLLAALLGAATASAVPQTAASDGPRHVLVIESYGAGFVPFNTLASVFRSGLANASREPLDVREVVLDLGSSAPGPLQDRFAAYVQSLVTWTSPDLVVALGGPAVAFTVAFRGQLFPHTPLLLGGTDARLMATSELRPTDGVVPVALDLAVLVDNVLAVLPETERIAVVLGTSPVERYWRAEMEREFTRFADRVAFNWWDDLSLSQMVARAAELPPFSAILFTLLLTDADGVPHSATDALHLLHPISRAPIFGVFDTQLGEGIVGGRVLPVTATAAQIVDVALRMLDGELATGTRPASIPVSTPLYDARELRRWGIDVSRLPEGSAVMFEPVSPWTLYRVPVIAGLSTLLVMSGLLIAVEFNRRKRATAEAALRDLSHRLLTTMEEDRRWLGRELHDDVSQRLARLAIDVSRLDADRTTPTHESTAAIRHSITQLSKDIHALSHWLRPSILDDLGLVEALRAEVTRYGQAEALAVEAQLPDREPRMPMETALCLYRIAQESMRNAARHGNPKHVSVALRPVDGGCQLEVRDDGVGFDPSRARGGGIGVASMNERIRLVGGKLTIDSQPNRGTTVRAWVPREAGEAP